MRWPQAQGPGLRLLFAAEKGLHKRIAIHPQVVSEFSEDRAKRSHAQWSMPGNRHVVFAVQRGSEPHVAA